MIYTRNGIWDVSLTPKFKHARTYTENLLSPVPWGTDVCGKQKQVFETYAIFWIRVTSTAWILGTQDSTQIIYRVMI